MIPNAIKQIFLDAITNYENQKSQKDEVREKEIKKLKKKIEQIHLPSILYFKKLEKTINKIQFGASGKLTGGYLSGSTLKDVLTKALKKAKDSFDEAIENELKKVPNDELFLQFTEARSEFYNYKRHFKYGKSAEELFGSLQRSKKENSVDAYSVYVEETAEHETKIFNYLANFLEKLVSENVNHDWSAIKSELVDIEKTAKSLSFKERNSITVIRQLEAKIGAYQVAEKVSNAMSDNHIKQSVSYERQIDDLKTKLEKTQSFNEEQALLITELRDQNQGLQEDINGLKEKNQQLQKQVQRVNQENKFLKQNLLTQYEQGIKLQEELNKLQEIKKKLDSLFAENDGVQMQEKLTEYLKALEESHDEIKKLKYDVIKLTNMVDKLSNTTTAEKPKMGGKLTLFQLGDYQIMSKSELTAIINELIKKLQMYQEASENKVNQSYQRGVSFGQSN